MSNTVTWSRLKQWRPGGWLRSSASLFFWLALRALAQVITVLALAKWLGAEGYGQLVSILAIATLFIPLAGLGLHGVLLREGAAHPDKLPALLKTILIRWSHGALIFSLFGIATTFFTLPATTSFLTLAFLVIAEVTSTSLIEILGRAQQALHRAAQYGAISTGLALTRLISLGLCLWLVTFDLSHWLWAYSLASLAYALFILLWSLKNFRLPTQPCITPPPLAEGVPFALGALSFRIQAEINKPVLSLIDLAAVGGLNIAQRMIDLANLPLIALQEALAPRIFSSTHYLRRTLISTVFLTTLALLGGIFIVAFAPSLLSYLGEDYSSATQAVVWLAWLPALQVIRNMLNIVLAKARPPNALNSVYLTTIGASFVLTLWLVPVYGLLGAVIALYLTEIVTVFAQFSCHKLFNREPST